MPPLQIIYSITILMNLFLLKYSENLSRIYLLQVKNQTIKYMVLYEIMK